MTLSKPERRSSKLAKKDLSTNNVFCKYWKAYIGLTTCF